MTFEKIGGISALGCAATYLFGFALLVTLLAPLGYGSNEIDVAAVVDFTAARPGILIVWNTVIYIVNALVLAVLVVALHARLAPATPGWAAATRALGLMWATLVLGAGMIANVAVEHTAQLAATDPAAAANLFEIMRTVELGLGGGNEIAGGVWILGVSIAGLRGRSIGKVPAILGIVTGASGLATIIPALGETTGAVFGLGAIAWFIAIGIALFRPAAKSRQAA